MLCKAIIGTFLALVAHQAAGQALMGSKQLSSDWGMSVEITVYDDVNDTVSITMVGPSNRWFGVGYGGTSMENTYAIIAYGTGNDVAVMERKLGGGSTETERAGTLLNSTVTIESDNTANGVRTVTLIRDRTIEDDDYYDFPNAAGSVNLIFARGSDDDETDVGAHGGSNAGISSISMYEPSLLGQLTLNSDWGTSVKVAVQGDDAYITMVGPSNRWFGVGFGGTEMDGTYAIIASGSGDTAAVSERNLGGGSSAESRAGTLLTATVTVVSDTSEDGTRTIMLTRNRAVDGDDYYTFPDVDADIPVIYARGAADDSTDPTEGHNGAANAGGATLSMEVEERYSGSVNIEGAKLNVSIDIDGDELTLTLCGQTTGFWMGAGFCDETEQCGMDGTYAFVVEGADSGPVERILGDHTAGTEINVRQSGLSYEANLEERCLGFTRECDVDEDADLYCGSDLAEMGTMVTKYLIAALGNTEEFAVHASKYQQSIDLCVYVNDMADEECQKATALDEADEDAAVPVGFLVGFVITLFSLLWN